MSKEINNAVDMNETADVSKIVFAKTKPEATIPSKSDENAGYDVYACFESEYIKLPANTTSLIPTGIASALPTNYYFQIEERGSTGSKGIKKSSGVIDSGFRGEWFIAITNANDVDLYIAKECVVDKLKEAAEILDVKILVYPYEKAIAQAVLHDVPAVAINEISYDELKEIKSERGIGALGSSNK